METQNTSQNCLNEAYDDQLKMIDIIKIKLSNDEFLEIQPNCNFSTSNYGIDFEHPFKTEFSKNTYKYANDAKFALVDYCKKQECNDDYFKMKLKNDGIYKKIENLRKNNIVFNGYLKIHDFQKCHNSEENSYIFITITNEFKKITDIDFNKLQILSQKLDNNNEKDIYFLDNNSKIDDFVISNNEYVVYNEDFDIKTYADFGRADSCAMYGLFMLHNTNRPEKRKLKSLYEKRFNNLTPLQKDNFKKIFNKNFKNFKKFIKSFR